MTTTTNTTTNTTRLYRGKSDCCRCGCKGTYFDRGHRLFSSVLKQYEAALAAADPSDVDADPDYTNVDLDNDRAICAYFS